MGETCFIVDDEPTEAMAVQLTLKEHFPGLDIFTANGSSRFFELLDHHKPDLLLIDIQMPGMNGLDMIKEVKEIYPKIRVIIISAHEYFEYAQRAIDLGVKRYLVKPASRSEIVAAVGDVLQVLQKEKISRNEQLTNREKVDLTSHFLKKELLSGMVNHSIMPADFDMLTNLLGLYDKKGFFVILKFRSPETAKRLPEIRSYWSSKYLAVIDAVFVDMHVFLIFHHSDDIQLIDKSLNSFKEKVQEEFIWGMSGEAQTYLQFVSAFEEAVSNLDREQLLKHRVEAYIRVNYDRDLKLEEVAAFAGFSVHYFSKWFKKNFNKNFSEFLQEMRLDKATQLLSQTELSVKEVSFRTGFSDPNYFSRLFKKVKGKKPTDFS